MSYVVDDILYDLFAYANLQTHDIFMTYFWVLIASNSPSDTKNKIINKTNTKKKNKNKNKQPYVCVCVCIQRVQLV